MKSLPEISARTKSPAAAIIIGLVGMAARPVQRFLCVLVDRNRDRLDMLKAMVFTRRGLAQFGGRVEPRRVVRLFVAPFQLFTPHQLRPPGTRAFVGPPSSFCWRDDANAVGADQFSRQPRHGGNVACRGRRHSAGNCRGDDWDRRQGAEGDLYLARRGVLAANAIQKLEDYRDKAAGNGQTS